MSDPAGNLFRMIRETFLDTCTDDDAPTGLLRLRIAGDDARLSWTPSDPPDVRPAPSYSFQVSARSLLLALRAAWGDAHPGTTDLDQARPATQRPPRPGAPNSRQPWSTEQDELVRDTWLAVPSTTPADEVIGELAGRLGRSRGSIRARVARTGCDPDVPGRTLRDDPPDEAPDDAPDGTPPDTGPA
jgi:hypothetical protein